MAAGNKGQRGGAQPGAGRKRKVDEDWARKVCMDAIILKYGSIEEGIQIILAGKEERLKLFIWTHVLGNTETSSKVKLSDHKGNKLDNPLGGGKLIIEVVRTVHNKDTQDDGSTPNENDNSSRLPEQEF